MKSRTWKQQYWFIFSWRVLYLFYIFFAQIMNQNDTKNKSQIEQQ